MRNKESAARRVGVLAPSRLKCFGVLGLPSCALAIAAVATHRHGGVVQGGEITDG
jgi:hypothetical protein